MGRSKYQCVSSISEAFNNTNFIISVTSGNNPSLHSPCAVVSVGWGPESKPTFIEVRNFFEGGPCKRSMRRNV